MMKIQTMNKKISVDSSADDDLRIEFRKKLKQRMLDDVFLEIKGTSNLVLGYQDRVLFRKNNLFQNAN